MEIKIMLGAAVFFGGWLCSYLFLRQICFNCMVAYPLIKKMNAIQADMIDLGAKRYTTVSMVVCSLVFLVAAAAVIAFCPLYLKICFGIGAVLCLVMFAAKTKPENRAMFDSFCDTYYRFVLDDELRTAIYNKKTGQIRSRLRAMGYIDTFVPEFK